MQQSEKYAYKIFRLRSFSKAAKELYISQPSLSATIKKLEKELGFRLFDRSRTPVTPTPEGKIYYEYLEETIKSEAETLQRIKTMKAPVSDKLSVGGVAYSARVLFPKVCGKLSERHPNTEIEINFGQFGSVNNLYENLEKGAVDIILCHTYDESKFKAIELFSERYVIAIRKDSPYAEKLLPYAVTRKEVLNGTFKKEISDFSIFDGVSFIRYGKSSSTWKHMHSLLEHCSFSNCHVSGSRSLDAHYNLMLYGKSAAITTETLVRQNSEKCDEILYFPTNVYRPVMLAYKKDVPLTDIAEEFIETAKAMCEQK